MTKVASLIQMLSVLKAREEIYDYLEQQTMKSSAYSVNGQKTTHTATLSIVLRLTRSISEELSAVTRYFKHQYFSNVVSVSKNDGCDG